MVTVRVRIRVRLRVRVTDGNKYSVLGNRSLIRVRVRDWGRG